MIPRKLKQSQAYVRRIKILHNLSDKFAQRRPKLRGRDNSRLSCAAVDMQPGQGFPIFVGGSRVAPLRRPSVQYASVKPVSVKTQPGRGIRGLRPEFPKIPHQTPNSWPLTSGNVGTSVSARNPQRETFVAGWAYKIRTAISAGSKSFTI
jgi:hypothetical protein